MSDLTFDAEEHRYFLDGEELPGVTNVMKLEGLIDDQWYTEFGRQRGKAVHLACELLDKGVLDWSTVDERIRGYARAWQNFTAELEPTWFAIEKHVHCPTWRYGGTLDRYGKPTFHHRNVLVDLKTGEPGRPVAIQLAAYANALGGDDHPDLWAVKLSADGKYHITPYSFAEQRYHFAVFTSALNLLRWKGEIAA